MSKTYKRIENIDEKIHDVKLPYNAWKVLFLVDEDTTADSIAQLLGEEISVVEQALDRLEKEQLVIGADHTGMKPEMEEPPAEAVEEELPPLEEEAIVEEETGDETPAAESLLEEEKETTAKETEEVPATQPEETPPVVEEEIAQETGSEDIEAVAQEETADIPLEEIPEEILSEETAAEEEAVTEEKKEDESEIEIEIAEQEEEQPETEKLDIEFEEEPAVVETAEAGPAAEEAEAAPEEPPAEEKEEITSDARKTILVVDDSIVIRKMVEIALEDEKDIRVETAVKGKEGMELMDKIQPDLVILDLMLPDIGGIELLKTIKASRGIPVIMLSGKDSPQMIENARNEGADAFLPKPFKDEELVEKIKSLLEI